MLPDLLTMRDKFPMLMDAFEDNFSLEDIADAVFKCGSDQDKAARLLSERLLKRRSQETTLAHDSSLSAWLLEEMSAEAGSSFSSASKGPAHHFSTSIRGLNVLSDTDSVYMQEVIKLDSDGKGELDKDLRDFIVMDSDADSDDEDYCSDSEAAWSHSMKRRDRSKSKSRSRSRSRARSLSKKRQPLPNNYFLLPGGYEEEPSCGELLGEIEVDDDVQEDTKPLRVIKSFVIYDVHNIRLDSHGRRVYKVEELDVKYDNNEELRMSGEVSLILADGSVDQQSVKVNSTTIFMWMRHSDGTIWAMTHFAWYRFDKPASVYLPYCEPLLKKVKIAHTILACLKDNEDLDLAQFQSTNLSDDEDEAATDTGDIALTVQDLKDHVEYIAEEVASAVSNKEVETSFDEVEDMPVMRGLSRLWSRQLRYAFLSKAKHQEPAACVTPLVAALADGNFNRLLVVADNRERAILSGMVSAEPGVLDDLDPLSTISWISECLRQEGDRAFYHKVYAALRIFQLNEMVFVRDPRGDTPRVGRLVSLFEQDKESFCHVRFLARGKSTVLGEMASWRELFLLDSCEDVLVEAIVGPCSVTFLTPGQGVPDDDYYFCRLWYDPERCVFEDLAKHDGDEDLQASYHATCWSCALASETQSTESPLRTIHHSSSDILAFAFDGQEYHQFDYVYLLRTRLDAGVYVPLKIPNHGEVAAPEPYRVGQIMDVIEGVKPSLPLVRIRLLTRYDDTLHKIPTITGRHDRVQREIARDCHRLLSTGNTIMCQADCLAGTCEVVEGHDGDAADLAWLKDQPDTFYCTTEDTMVDSIAEVCELCRTNRQEEVKRVKAFVSNPDNKLRALDLFAGCGGMTAGLEESFVVETRYAIERDLSAVETFRHNFPHVQVYHQDANLLLRQAIEEYHGTMKEDGVLTQDLAGAPLPRMPQPGDVDFIYCGPPCQGFSRMNRSKHGDELKNSLIATALSYVDHYKPAFFLLENVRDIIHYKFGVQLVDGKRQGGVTMGVVKYILRCLTEMGYQCRFGLLQAGHYGVPQSRRRFFVWGAKIGYELPDFPLPRTCFPFFKSLAIPPPLPGAPPFHYQGKRLYYASYPAITVRDAISDLSPFEFKNPQQAIFDTWPFLAHEHPFPLLKDNAVDSIPPPLSTFYVTLPQSDYQRQLRGLQASQEYGPGTTIFVWNHVSRTFNPLNTQRICRIPMRPNADHRDLPKRLDLWCLQDPQSAAARHRFYPGSYGRLDFEGHFRTVIASVNPGGQQGKVVHPNQDRVLSVRECARAQGFKDGFLFIGKKAVRGVGIGDGGGGGGSGDCDSEEEGNECGRQGGVGAGGSSGGGGGGGRGNVEVNYDLSQRDNGTLAEMYRMIGNAVPPPLARALGEKLREAMMKRQRTRKGKEKLVN